MPDGTPQTPDFSDLRVRAIEQAKTELPQPKVAAPWEEEPRLNLPATTKLGQAYEHAKQFLDTHEQHLSDTVLKPFRQGLDNMADELQKASESGHTQSGGQMTPVTRALAGGTSAALRMVPVGSDVKSTAQALIAPPALGLEGKALSEEVQAAEKFAGLRVRPAEPEIAYRVRPVGQTGVKAKDRPAATSSAEKALAYKENLESMTGTPHEVVQVPLKPGEHTKHTVNVPEGETWYSFQKAIPEEQVKPHKPGSQTEQKPAASEEKPDYKGAAEKHGAEFRGIQEGVEGKHPSLAVFQDLKSKTSVAVRLDEWSPAKLKEHLDIARTRMGVKPIKFGDSELVKNNPKASKGLKEPENKSKIVIEGIDELKANPEGRYSDKIKIDPFQKDYVPPIKRQPVKTA